MTCILDRFGISHSKLHIYTKSSSTFQPVIQHQYQHKSANLKRLLLAFAAFLGFIVSLPAMASFLQRLTRPFTSSTLAFAPEANAAATDPNIRWETATLAAGCFWGIEHAYRHKFREPQTLKDARVGYVGGNTQNPSYTAVCSGRTGRKCFIPTQACCLVEMLLT